MDWHARPTGTTCDSSASPAALGSDRLQARVLGTAGASSGRKAAPLKRAPERQRWELVQPHPRSVQRQFLPCHAPGEPCPSSAVFCYPPSCFLPSPLKAPPHHGVSWALRPLGRAMAEGAAIELHAPTLLDTWKMTAEWDLSDGFGVGWLGWRGPLQARAAPMGQSFSYFGSRQADQAGKDWGLS